MVTIKFDVTWTEPHDPGINGSAMAWGDGILRVFGSPVWCRGTDAQPEPVTWSWIELLEFLASRWPYLTTEQEYPAGLIPKDPRELRRALYRAWDDAYYREEEKERQDEAVFHFEERHDLARALCGITLPSVYILREGEMAWVTTDEQAQQVPLKHVMSELEAIGEVIAKRVSTATPTTRSRAALQAWSERKQIPKSLLIRLATGMWKQEFTEELPSNDLQFWELEAKPGADSELAAAARMMGRGHRADRGLIVREIKKFPRGDLSALNRLTDLLLPRLDPWLGEEPWSQGTKLANQVHNELSLPDRPLNIEKIFADYNVPIVEAHMSPSIEAVGCWGPNHGPVVFINVDGRRSSTDWGRRATLAHEFCHLVVDRKRSLPLAEVLGGRSPDVAEQRANAFAAQLAAPQWEAKRIFLEHNRSVKATLAAIQAKYKVGLVLAANQLKHQKLTNLTYSEITELDHIIKSGSELGE